MNVENFKVGAFGKLLFISRMSLIKVYIEMTTM